MINSNQIPRHKNAKKNDFIESHLDLRKQVIFIN